MKKKLVLSFILGLLLASTVVYGAYKYQATDVGYSPKNSDFKVDNVSDAIDELNKKVELKSKYNIIFSIYKISSEKIIIDIEENDNFVNYYCKINDAIATILYNNRCVFDNLNENTNYQITIVGVDKQSNQSEKTVSVKTRNKLVMDSGYLTTGSTYGNVSITTNNPSSYAGLSITGNTSSEHNRDLNYFNRWYKTIDLSEYTSLSFYARKPANHGCVGIYLDTSSLFHISYGSLDNTWKKYSVDLTNYTGNHVVTIFGGYSDSSGSTSSNTQYYDIELK